MAETTARTWTQSQMLSLVSRLRGDSPLRPHDLGFAADWIAALLAERDRSTPTEELRTFLKNIIRFGASPTDHPMWREGQHVLAQSVLSRLDGDAPLMPIGEASAPAAQPATPTGEK